MASQTKFTEQLYSHWPQKKSSGLAPKALHLVHQNQGRGYSACSPSSCQFGPAVEEGVLGVGVLKGEI